jgi:DNA sulfur modification protein DndD
MIINSLTLSNFRQFCGENQTIRFSVDPSKKVTIVVAESGVGKTTLIQAFQWVLYGTCKYTSILNETEKQDLAPKHFVTVSVSVDLTHSGKRYIITRKQDFFKINVKVEPQESILTVDSKTDEGISDSKRGREATQIIKEIMPKDLFPYFFLEGESLTKVGSLMAKGKSGANSEFVKAIKGLLGFNYLYETTSHLKRVCDDYQTEIANCTTNSKLKENIEEVAKYNEKISLDKTRCDEIDKEITYNKGQKESFSDQIAAYGEVEGKQNRTRVLGNELASLKEQIVAAKKIVFKKFSTDGLYYVLNSLVPKATDVLKDSDSMDKGITGINVDAINYILNHHECVCGHKIVEGSEEWKKLEEWITYLPPNNIASEINNFKDDIIFINNRSGAFYDDFSRERINLNQLVDSFNNKTDELEALNKEIANVNVDVGQLKEKEREYDNKIIQLSIEKQNKKREIDDLNEKIIGLEAIQDQYKRLDAKTHQIQNYYYQASLLKHRIERFCDKKETEKRAALERAINSIFADFYKEKITFRLDQNYGVQISTYDSDLSDDFTSGGQDVAVALAFIGSIIKVNGEKGCDPDNIEEDDNKEIYPLVMDAPTSNFGMKQMDSFSKIIPKITDQIIVFINDKDGPILLDKMKSEICEKWLLKKQDSYHSVIVEDK